jgi:NADPH:quinone reductase-like Zn-dependent oxidoreductase
VWFCANSSLAGAGAFQEYSVHFATEVAHIPRNVSDDEAATLGTGLVTAGVVLFRTLDFPLDSLLGSSTSKKTDAPWILVWGGSGITGVYLIQLASILGYRVICAASPVNHSYVRSLGADVVVDRWGAPSELIESIRTATKDEVSTLLCCKLTSGAPRNRQRRKCNGHNLQSGTAGIIPLARTTSVRSRRHPLYSRPTGRPGRVASRGSRCGRCSPSGVASCQFLHHFLQPSSIL